MKKYIKLALTSVATLAFASTAHADVITFDDLGGANGDTFTGPYAEDGLSIRAAGGDVFEGHIFGNPEPSLVVGSIFGGGPFGVVSITGGLFQFDSFDLASSGGPADYTVQGFLGAANIFTYSGSIAGGSNFQTIAGMAGTIDELNFILTPNGSSLNLDNIAFTAGAVPEPATWAFLILGFGAIGGAMRVRRTRVSYAV